MTYSIRVFAPNDILTTEGNVVVANTSIPIEDILASPDFEWYRGMCLTATEDGSNLRLFSGIFNDHTCVSVDQDSALIVKITCSLTDHDLFKFWQNTTDGYIMSVIIDHVVSVTALQTATREIMLRMKLCLASDDYKFFESLTPQTPVSDTIKRRLASILNRRDTISNKTIYFAMSALVDAATVILGKEVRFLDMCANYTESFASSHHLTIHQSEANTAFLLRQIIPFHEIVHGILNGAADGMADGMLSL